MRILLEPWPWYVAGPLIAVIMGSLLYLGRNFGMSANLRTLCTIAGAGRIHDFFCFEWKSQLWNLVFALGAIGGGFLMSSVGSKAGDIALTDSVLRNLQGLGIDTQGHFSPVAIFGQNGEWPPLSGLLALTVGGFLIGFGARWAGGCTSGHAISGLADLQKGSLFAVIGFFVGGLLMTWWILPLWFGGMG